jgi:1-deoxy-D-xylulose-5-phosphate reductoisomerase
MNAANEVLVNSFLEKRLAWSDIATKLETLMQRHVVQQVHSLDDVMQVDAIARREARLEG